ncbi:MAG TPA: hypothetical protein VF209_02550 [Patescibacteria group bacterium]
MSTKENENGQPRGAVPRGRHEGDPLVAVAGRYREVLFQRQQAKAQAESNNPQQQASPEVKLQALKDEWLSLAVQWWETKDFDVLTQCQIVYFELIDAGADPAELDLLVAEEAKS